MRKSLIYTRNADNSIMSIDRVRELAPAAFATTKAEHLTDRYHSLHTADLLPIMADHGFFPTQAAQVKARKNGNAEHKQHLLAFATPESIAQELRPEIILYNSHDGTGAVRLFAGAYRMICSNGIVGGSGLQSRVYHNVNSMRGFEDMLKNAIESLPVLMDTMHRLRGVMLDRATIYDMATKAVELRWDKYVEGSDKRGSFYTEQTIEQVTRLQRSEDIGADAFTVWNRIQENVLRGNAFVRSVTDLRTIDRKARAVSSVKEHVRINEALWDIVDV